MKKNKIKDFLYIFTIVGCVSLLVFKLFYNDRPVKIKRGDTITSIPSSSDPKTELEFLTSDDINFDKIVEGEILNFEYKIKNVGKNPLIIYDVLLSCQCTDYELSKKVVLPSDSTLITIKFNSKNKKNFTSAQALIIANTKQQAHKIFFYGFVTPNKEGR